jgi:F-type H+-transporting ATPase subunit epsilon
MADDRSKTLRIEVVTPRAAVLTETAASVVLPGWDGELEVYAGGRPILLALRPGRMICHYPGPEIDAIYYIGGGYAEILADSIVVLADECEPAGEVDAAAAKEALSEAAKALDERRLHRYDENDAHRLAVARAEARIEIGD